MHRIDRIVTNTLKSIKQKTNTSSDHSTQTTTKKTFNSQLSFGQKVIATSYVTIIHPNANDSLASKIKNYLVSNSIVAVSVK